MASKNGDSIASALIPPPRGNCLTTTSNSTFLELLRAEIKVILQLVVYHQSVHLGAKLLENHDQRVFFS
jgi:hypothetical protein